MHSVVILRLLVLLALANGTPVIAKNILGNRFSYPLDGNLNSSMAGPSSAVPRRSAGLYSRCW
jgi:hypothetical protein